MKYPWKSAHISNNNCCIQNLKVEMNPHKMCQFRSTVFLNLKAGEEYRGVKITNAAYVSTGI